MTDQQNTASDQQNNQTDQSAGGTQTNLSTADLVSAANQQQNQTAANNNTEVETRPSNATSGDQPAPLFAGDQADSFRSRWTEIQTSFVDDPRQAVEQADGLVADVIQRLAQLFADERNKLESQWGEGGNVDTEDLRVALQRYRSFFDRLLSV